MPSKALLSLMLFAAAPIAAQAPTPPPFKPFTAEESERYLASGRKMMQWFLDGEADSLVAHWEQDESEPMTIDVMRGMMDTFNERAGQVSRIVAEKMTRRMGKPQFWWEAEVVNFTAEPVVLRWVFTEDGKIGGVGFSPKSRALSDPEG